MSLNSLTKYALELCEFRISGKWFLVVLVYKINFELSTVAKFGLLFNFCWFNGWKIFISMYHPLVSYNSKWAINKTENKAKTWEVLSSWPCLWKYQIFLRLYGGQGLTDPEPSKSDKLTGTVCILFWQTSRIEI